MQSRERRRRSFLIAIAIVIGIFAGIAPQPGNGHVTAAGQERSAAEEPRRTVIWIGLDGFRWDVIDRFPAPNLRRLAARGVRGRMTPRFPSVTYPNFYAMATGLQPEHNGIVANAMYDPLLGTAFGEKSWKDDRWWGGEPIWATLERQGGTAGVVSWVGSEAGPAQGRPTYAMSYRPFADELSEEDRVRHVLRMLDLPPALRPQLVTLYSDLYDDQTQDFGIGSPEEAAAVARIDAMFGALLSGLDHRGLLDTVNIIVVADHGMTAVAANPVIMLDDYIDPATIRTDAINGGAFATLWPLSESPERLKEKLRAVPHLSVYLRQEIPARFHNADHRRVAPVLLLAEEGWIIALRQDARLLRFKALHGYDNTLPSMRATFIAAGPDFKQGVETGVFENVDIYPLLAHLLHVTPAQNDGTLCTFRGVLARRPEGC